MYYFQSGSVKKKKKNENQSGPNHGTSNLNTDIVMYTNKTKKPTNLGIYLFIKLGSRVQCNTKHIIWYGLSKYRLNLTDRSINGPKCFNTYSPVHGLLY
jgi:hypothetical protein